MIDYNLIRSKRRTVALYVRNGAAEVRAPLNAAKREIDKFVASKEKWIRKCLEASRERERRRDTFSITYGGTVVYRGNQYPVAAKSGTRIGYDGTRFYVPYGLTPDKIKSACAQIYRMLAKRDLTKKTFAFAKQMGVMPAAVKITGAKTRWGSCSSKKNVNFSWRLIMAEDDVIDYLVVHELAHLTELNHSKRFWKIVENILPDYRERQIKLKALQRKLSTENWG